ncbi:ribosome recycling factor family protein [Shewanella waksmanii]|uniref:ribosome recycling factor family protein n=1 Tax=Shewanella waksmanii TaxID=213783 RepID=UPI0037354C10
MNKQRAIAAENGITVRLPSLIHRIGRDGVNQARVLATQYRCQLQRVRRSRHWQLMGEACEVQSLCLYLKLQPESWGYLIAKLDAELALHGDKLVSIEQRLNQLVLANPSITLAELMLQTDCTLAQARMARMNTEI